MNTKDIKKYECPEFGSIRAMVDEKDEPWFVGKDVAEKLGYSKARNAIAAHVEDEDKKDAPIQGDLGGVQQMTIINESGLYSLILSSKLPTAKRFKHWVTSEVLPQIRKTGGYIPAGENEDENTILAKALLIAERTIQEQKRLEAYRTKSGTNLFGDVLWNDTYLVWTEKGRKFLTEQLGRA